MMRLWVGLVLLVAALASGCLQKDSTSTVYLDPDGHCTWVVLEQHVRSDAEQSGERDDEERTYVETIAADRHPVAVAFRAIGGQDVRTTWLRNRRPWSAVTNASFGTLDGPFEAAFTACGVGYTSATTTRGGSTTWRAELQIPEADAGESPDCKAIVEGLADVLDGSVMLTRGRFVDAAGFEIERPDKAVLSKGVVDNEAAWKPGARLVLSLSWTTER